MKTTQELIDALRAEDATIDLGMRHILNDAALIRVNAIETLARCVSANPTRVITALTQSALDPNNNVKLFGNITVAHVAIANLLRIGTAEAIESGNLTIKQIPIEQLKEFKSYLRSEGIHADD